MNRVVVDSSVAAKWFDRGEEPHRMEALDLLRAAVEENLEVHAPILLLFELGNVFAGRARKPGGDPGAESLEDLFGMSLRWQPFDLPLSLRSLALANRHRLTFYDAAFVALAESLGATLVTADEALARPFPRTLVRRLGKDPIPT